jgi:ATP-dependent Clp protease protease subunit
MTRSTMRPDGPNFPGFPRPYPHIPPEVPPGTPPRPATPPPVPTVRMPSDDLRSQVYDQLLARRTMFLERPLDTETASFLAAQLMTLDADGDDEQPVTLMVNSPGGPLDAAAAVLDTLDLMRCPVDTTCIGQATGTAAVVVAAGTGTRRAGMSAQFRLRLPDVDLTGSANQLRDEVAHVNRLHELMVDRLATVTGQERRLVERDVEQGRALSADEAQTYGLVDELVQRRR